jgi:hypothetical protein
MSIRIEHVAKSFSAYPALDDISLQIEARQVRARRRCFVLSPASKSPSRAASFSATAT